MEAEFSIVSDDLFNVNGSQSWKYHAVWRNNGGVFRVVVDTSNSAVQSRADVSVWGVGGWNFHTSLPAPDWWKDAPSYVKAELDAQDVALFHSVERELLERTAAALWGATGVVLLRDEA